MGKEKFKEMYNQIQLDGEQKERIWNHIEAEGRESEGRKRFHAPAFTAICICFILLVGVPVLAANTSVIQKFIWSLGLLNGTDAETTDAQKRIYEKYGCELKNEIVLGDSTVRLEAMISDGHNIYIPFSANFSSLLSDQAARLKFLFKDAEKGEDALTPVTVLDSSHQKDGIMRGCYLLTSYEREMKQGDVLQIFDWKKWEEKEKEGKIYAEIKSSLPALDEIKIDTIAESRRVSVKAIQEKLPEGIWIEEMKLSPLSFTIEGEAGRDAADTVFNAGSKMTVELKDGSVVEEASTGPQLCMTEEGEVCVMALFEAPVHLEDVAGIRIHSDYYGSYDLWIPVGQEEGR